MSPTQEHEAKPPRFAPGPLIIQKRKPAVHTPPSKTPPKPADHKVIIPIRHYANPKVRRREHGAPATNLSPETRKLRVGLWLTNTKHYSGGRIHLFQYIHCLASTGLVDVFMMTEFDPPWEIDYPPMPNFKLIHLGGSYSPPDDLDIVIADRNKKLDQALEYKKSHPNCIAMAFNFETENWARAVWPPLGKVISAERVRDGYGCCDHLLANSEESAKWLRVWMVDRFGDKFDIPITPLPPAVNTFALDTASSATPGGLARRLLTRGRKYAVWVSRGVPHKNQTLAISSIWALDTPFDLVVIGDKRKICNDVKNHEFHFAKEISDVEKYQLMMCAHTVLAPSLFEGYGMVPGEALASGVVPVVFDLPVLRQVYGNRLDYVEHANFDAYASRVAKVIKAPKNTSDASEAREKYGMARMKERVCALPYHNVGRTSVTAQMICYWGFSSEAIESIYDQVDQIVIAYGPVELVKKRGVEPDGSLDAIRAMPDPDNKIQLYTRDCWADKAEMHNFCCRKTRGNRVLVTAGDHVIVGLDEWIADDKIFAACPRFVHFWQDGSHYVTMAPDGSGGNWGRPVKPFGSFSSHCLWTYWRPSYRYRIQNQICDANGKDVNAEDRPGKRGYACERHPNTVFYHLGNLLPTATMKAKEQFYLDRDNTQPQARMSGLIHNVDWKLPDIVKRALTRLGVSYEPA